MKKLLELNPSGNINYNNSQELLKEFRKRLGESEYNGVVMDMSGVGFVDSSGLSIIITLSKDCDKRKIGFSIKNCNKKVLGLFKSLNLDKAIAIS